MLTAPYVNIAQFFYAIGNTTAVCLTQDLSPEQPANILLLGCGDVRNILFTCYSENLLNNRNIDITCCDLQKAVIARNILLFTLLVDDTYAASNDAVWDIYYHFNLNDKSLKLLQVQSEKLCRLAESIQSWEASAYGKLIRFCNDRNLAMVREVWTFYNKASRPGPERDGLIRKLQESVTWRQRMASGMVMTGIRSAAPVGIEAVDELPKFHDHYWNHGITEESAQKKGARFANPMFATTDVDSSVLHYGTDPLLGFHLATAYLSLSSHSPLRPKFDRNVTHCKAVHAARAQFQAWAATFRKIAGQNLTMRFVVGDALAFCHTLQHRATAKEHERANWCTAQYTVEPLILDGKDYNKNGNVPRTFNAIDTSNLADHIGIVNLLVAATPLLEKSPWSSIYTELLVKQADDHQALTENLLCGHFTTMSTLLGLFPVEFFSNATAISNADQVLMESVLTESSKDTGQQLHRLAWKRSSHCLSTKTGEQDLDQPLHFDEEDLAHLLHKTYAVMFRHENLAGLFAKLVFYHRGSFASLLRYVKNVSKVQWDKMMKLLLDLIERDNSSLIRAYYYQELYAHLHLLGLYTPDYFYATSRLFRSNVAKNSRQMGLCAWREIPPVVCITLEVPRANLHVITRIPVQQLSTPLVQCAIQAPRTSTINQWHSIFCAVQLSFGKISTSGDRNGGDFELHVKEDELRWKGTSPLLVSFYVPSHVILAEPTAARISFGIQKNTRNLFLLMDKLGMELKLFETNLGNQEHIFVTKYLPNQRGYTSICRHEASDIESRETERKPFRITTTAHVARSTGRIESFTGRIDFISEGLKSALAGKAVIKTYQLSPRTIEITIGENGFKYLLQFPTPVSESRAKTRIARKSSYIETKVPITDHTEGTGFPKFIYPVFATKAEPVLWNMPFLNLDRLPIIDVAKPEGLLWLTPHTSLQMSARERKSRAYDQVNPGYVKKDVRINFKDSLFSMFMTFPGLKSLQRMRVMGLYHPGRGGVNILIFISELRLDMGNQTAILDAAVLPLTHDLVPRISKFLTSLASLPQNMITVDDEELALWKTVLPAYVERCRTWTHLPICEYKVKGRIPLSTEYAQPFLCSCGNGTVPRDFMKDFPHFHTVCKYMTRIAISPSYAVPFVEKMFSVDEFMKAKKLQEIKNRESKCRNCERTKHVSGADLSVCARCRVVKYCSVECQKAHWNVHKKECVKATGEVKEGGKRGGEKKGNKDLDALADAMEAEGLD